MSLDNYKARLAAHDWYYAESDDIEVYQDGRKERNLLTAIAHTHGPEYAKAFDDAWFKCFGPEFSKSNVRANAPMIKAGLYKMEELK